MSLIGKLFYLGENEALIVEEGNGNQYYFDPDNVRGFRGRGFREEEIVRFTPIKPCGGKWTVDTIERLLFPYTEIVPREKGGGYILHDQILGNY